MKIPFLFELKSLTAAIIICILLPSEAVASHAVGAELRYECIGGNTYRVFYTLYRDCSGIPVQPNYLISISNNCGASNPWLTVYLDSTEEIFRTCPSQPTKCVDPGSPYFGVEANYYHGDVTLPSSCDHWTFSYAECCRNAAITNIQVPSSYNLYVETTLNNLDAPCNNSPSFSNPPVYFICAGQIQYLSSLTYDLDGDSITYEMVAPLSAPGQAIPHDTGQGLSATQPVTYSGTDSTRFNPVNGQIKMLPDGPQITVVAIKVSEYRSGILIGTIIRDIQVIVDNCTNAIPELSGINGTNIYTTTVIAGDTICFTVYSNDPDPADNLWMNWNYGIPSAQVSITGSPHPDMNFCWATIASDANPVPYSFEVILSDDHCPVSLSTFQNYSILVIPDTSTMGLGNVPSEVIFTIYPNPSGGKYRIESHKKITDWIVYDTMGREVIRKEKENSVIDISNQPNGVYFFQGVLTDHLTVQRMLMKE